MKRPLNDTNRPMDVLTGFFAEWYNVIRDSVGLYGRLLVSGAVGNFIDRVRFGYVRDFIYFKLINFPVFNVADCYVTVSVALLIILILFVYKEDDFGFLKLSKKGDNNE